MFNYENLKPNQIVVVKYDSGGFHPGTLERAYYLEVLKVILIDEDFFRAEIIYSWTGLKILNDVTHFVSLFQHGKKNPTFKYFKSDIIEIK